MSAAASIARQRKLQGLDTTQKCWRLYAEHGLSQRQVAAELNLTQGAVSKALRRGEQLAIDQLKASIDAHKARTLDRLEWLYAEAREAWEASKEGTTKKTSAQIDGGRDSGQRTAEIEHTDTPGDPKYLAQALKALEGIRKLLGLDAPVKVQPVDPVRPLADVPLDQIQREMVDLFTQAGITADTLLARGPQGAQ